MKWFLVVLVFLTMSCAHKPVSEHVNDNGLVVQNIGKVGACDLYRFTDAGHVVWVTMCQNGLAMAAN